MSDSRKLSDVLKSTQTASSLSGLSMLLVNSLGELAKNPDALSPFLTVKTYPAGMDLNDFVTPGMFKFSSNPKNSPINLAGNFLYVWSHTAGYVSQKVEDLMWGHGIYHRHMRDGGDWSSWVKVGSET